MILLPSQIPDESLFPGIRTIKHGAVAIQPIRFFHGTFTESLNLPDSGILQQNRQNMGGGFLNIFAAQTIQFADRVEYRRNSVDLLHDQSSAVVEIVFAARLKTGSRRLIRRFRKTGTGQNRSGKRCRRTKCT